MTQGRRLRPGAHVVSRVGCVTRPIVVRLSKRLLNLTDADNLGTGIKQTACGYL
jgi:hypothetical protein